MKITNVGFIGLGNIGRPIARNLATSKFSLHVYDVDANAVSELVGLGAAASESPAVMAARCDAIGICVRDDDQVDQVLTGPNGLLAGANEGLHVLIHSTVSAKGFRRWQALVEPLGVTLVDANVTGGAIAVNAQRLCFMVGASEVTLDYIRPVLETSTCRGGAIVHAGPSGSGLVLKLANNAMASFAFVAMHEAAKMVEASGGSVDRLIEVGEANGVVTNQMKAFIENRIDMIEKYSLTGFRERYLGFSQLMEKDMRYVIQSGTELGIALPSSDHIHAIIASVFLNEH